MGQPVVHFEIIGKDGDKLKSYYSELFGWDIDAGHPMKYGIVKGEDNPSSIGSIGGGVATGPGQSAFTRIRSRAWTIASSRVIASTAPLLAV